MKKKDYSCQTNARHLLLHELLLDLPMYHKMHQLVMLLNHRRCHEHWPSNPTKEKRKKAERLIKKGLKKTLPLKKILTSFVLWRATSLEHQNVKREVIVEFFSWFFFGGFDTGFWVFEVLRFVFVMEPSPLSQVSDAVASVLRSPRTSSSYLLLLQQLRGSNTPDTMASQEFASRMMPPSIPNWLSSFCRRT